MEKVRGRELPRQLLLRFCVFTGCGIGVHLMSSSALSKCTLRNGAGARCVPGRVARWTSFARTHKCFLDKVCLHQADLQRKQDGIASRNVVVLFSRNFVVLDTSD